VYALDRENGKVVWTVNTGGYIQGSPAAGSGKIFIGSRATRILALDQKTGEQSWVYTHPDGSWVESSPVYQDGIVYIGSSDALKLQAFSADTGDVKWQFNTNAWAWGKPKVTSDAVYVGGISATPYYVDGVILSRGVSAVDRATGELIWNVETNAIDGYISGGVFSTPVVVGNTLYVASIDGKILAIQI
jgi:eukaryotic-like serine/threonine-protein kinase